MSACLVFVFAALVEYAMVNVYARRRFGQLRPPLALPLSTMVVRCCHYCGPLMPLWWSSPWWWVRCRRCHCAGQLVPLWWSTPRWWVRCWRCRWWSPDATTVVQSAVVGPVLMLPLVVP